MAICVILQRPLPYAARSFSQLTMQTILRRRMRSALLLLLVYVPMMMTVALHRHGGEPETYVAAYCNDCLHHVHHGHLMATQHAAHDCVICQLQSMPFLVPVLTVLAVAVGACRFLGVAACCATVLRACGMASPRAPPMTGISFI